MRTFFITYLPAGKACQEPDWAEVHAENVGQVAEVAANHGWRLMSLHDTDCWRPKLRVATACHLEALELDRFLHYHRRNRREDPEWLTLVRERADRLHRVADSP